MIQIQHALPRRRPRLLLSYRCMHTPASRWPPLRHGPCRRQLGPWPAPLATSGQQHRAATHAWLRPPSSHALRRCVSHASPRLGHHVPWPVLPAPTPRLLLLTATSMLCLPRPERHAAAPWSHACTKLGCSSTAPARSPPGRRRRRVAAGQPAWSHCSLLQCRRPA